MLVLQKSCEPTEVSLLHSSELLLSSKQRVERSKLNPETSKVQTSTRTQTSSFQHRTDLRRYSMHMKVCLRYAGFLSTATEYLITDGACSPFGYTKTCSL